VLRRIETLHELDQIWLPQLGVEMAEMAVCVGAGRDQHIAPALDPLHRSLNRTKLRGVGMILGVIDQQDTGLDLVEVGLGVVVADRLDCP
jgi:hypothetical protein